MRDIAAVIHALVAFRLNYCNVLHAELPLELPLKFQLVQNTAGTASWLKPVERSYHPSVTELHWLTISFHAKFNLLVMTFKAVYWLRQDVWMFLLSHWNHQERSYAATGWSQYRVDCCHGDATNTLPSKPRLNPSLLSFRRQVKLELFRWPFMYSPS